MTHTLIIGEMGSTPEGDLDAMKRLVVVADECGADCVKNQWVSNAQTMCDRRHAPEYLDSYLKLQYPLEWHADLRAYAKDLGMQYACTAYIPGDPTLLAPFVDYLKISSFENTDAALVREAVSVVSEARVIISLGMCPPTSWPVAGWYVPRHAKYLHCVSAYPTPLRALNLRAIRPMPPEEDLLDGFSDHSRDVRVGAWAVAAGAEILETHFRLDSCDPANKDYAVAFTPAEFAEYIRNVRDCEAAMGDGVKRVADCELPMTKYRV